MWDLPYYYHRIPRRDGIESSSTEIWPLAVYTLLVILLVIAMLVVSWLLGQRRREDATNDPFESGIVSVCSSQVRISVEFYLVAIFFVIFDLEAVFIFAWAVAFFELGWKGYISMLIFIGVLGLALIYAWRIGGLDWGNKVRVGLDRAKKEDNKMRKQNIEMESK